MIRSSKPSSLVCPLATICGSKLPLRSRGIASSIAPSSPSTVLLEWPLRLLPLPRPARSPFSYPRCSLSSAPSARSSSFFLSSLKSPSSPSRSCGELYPCSSSSITSSLIARAMSLTPLLHRVHHGSNLHKISDTLPAGARGLACVRVRRGGGRTLGMRPETDDTGHNAQHPHKPLPRGLSPPSAPPQP